jgi:hypothetical protein
MFNGFFMTTFVNTWPPSLKICLSQGKFHRLFSVFLTNRIEPTLSFQVQLMFVSPTEAIAELVSNSTKEQLHETDTPT